MMFHTVLLIASLTIPTPTAPLLQGTATITPNTPFVLVADHDGANTTEYRLLQDERLVETQPRSAWADGMVVFNRAGLPVGTYIFKAQALNIVGADAKVAVSGELVLVVQPSVVGKFKVGDRVVAYSGTEYGAGVAVWTQPTLASFPFLGVHPAGTKGVVVDGPVFADDHFWIKVDYDNTEIDGWSTESNLDLVPVTVDPCVAEPITLSVTAWPTKNRKTSASFSVFSPRTTNTMVTFTFAGVKSVSATATDGTCSITVTRGL